MGQKISIIIPAYNKDLTIFKALSSIYQHLIKFATDFEIIIVNDGSTDKTLVESKRFKSLQEENRIHIYNYNYNIGKGYALRHGFNNSSGDIIVFFDADLDIDCSKIITSIKLLQQKNADIVIGSKYHLESRISYPILRRIYSKILQKIVKFLFNLNVTDTQVGLKVFRRKILTEIMPKLVVKKFAFDLELLIVVYMYGYTNIVETPIVLNHNKLGSTIGLKAVKDFFQDVLAIYYRKNIIKFYETNKLNYPNLVLQTASLQQQHK
ncbi:glycosyltransferase [Candidatus Gottesmanbacteria bacterium]|nr:glycosyltransferase [Candidatus Gottesmanbacteria bacterium]